MKRRDFFRLGLQKATSFVVEEAQLRVEQKARTWIRPPFAVAELDFLLRCSRCDDCTNACPYDVIFPLPAKYGVQAVSTPAMDLVGKGCHLCDGWPCVSACKTGALSIEKPDRNERGGDGINLPQPAETAMPKLALMKIDPRTCLPYSGPECGACAAVCTIMGALIWDGTRPQINMEFCTGCAMCREACITEPKSISISTLPPETRAKSANGTGAETPPD